MHNLTEQIIFVKPHFYKEAGFAGLWDWEIAKSLGVRVDHVTHKLGRNRSFFEQNQISLYKEIKRNQDGASRIVFFLPTELAKYFVCSWKNHMGWSYWLFLLECEQVATELTPKLFERIRFLEDKLANCSDTPKLESKKGTMGYVPVERETLWGGVETFGYELAPKEDADPVDLARGKLRHNTRVQFGLTRSSEDARRVVDSSFSKKPSKKLSS